MVYSVSVRCNYRYKAPNQALGRCYRRILVLARVHWQISVLLHVKHAPLSQVVTPEDAAALKEAEELVEDVLAAALTDKKVIVLRPPKPPRRVRPTAFPDGVRGPLQFPPSGL